MYIDNNRELTFKIMFNIMNCVSMIGKVSNKILNYKTEFDQLLKNKYTRSFCDTIILMMSPKLLANFTSGLMVDWLTTMTPTQVWNSTISKIKKQQPDKGDDDFSDVNNSQKVRYRLNKLLDLESIEVIPLLARYPFESSVNYTFIKKYIPVMFRVLQQMIDEGIITGDPTNSVNRLKTMEDYAKGLGNKLSNRWRLYLSIYSFVGFPHYPFLNEDMEAAAKTWVGTYKDKYWYNGAKWTKEGYDTIFNKEIIKVFDELDVKVRNDITLEEFIQNRDLWATSGSTLSKDKELVAHILVAGKRRSLNKMEIGELMSTKELLEFIYRGKDQKSWSRSLFKSEIGKVRLAINCDFRMYLIESYIAYRLGGDYIRGNKGIALGENNSQVKERETVFVQQVKNTTLIKVPADYSKFDRTVNKQEDDSFTNEKLKRAKIEPELHEIYLQLRSNRWFELTSQQEQGKIVFTIEVKNGVESGKRDTATEDSVINRVWKNLAVANLRRMGLEIKIVDSRSSGDDVWLVFERIVDVLNFIYAINSSGALINTHKNYASQTRSEFLRKIYEGNSIRGYPWRILPTLTHRKPNKPEVTTVPSEINSVTNLIAQIARRLRQYKEFDPLILMKEYLEKTIMTNDLSLVPAPQHLGGLSCPYIKWEGYYSQQTAIMETTVDNMTYINGKPLRFYGSEDYMNKIITNSNTGIVTEPTIDSIITHAKTKLINLTSPKDIKTYKDKLFTILRTGSNNPIKEKHDVELSDIKVSSQIYASEKSAQERIKYWKDFKLATDSPKSLRKLMIESAYPRDIKIMSKVAKVANRLGFAAAIDYVSGKIYHPVDINLRPEEVQLLLNKNYVTFDDAIVGNDKLNVFDLYNIADLIQQRFKLSPVYNEVCLLNEN